MNRDARGGAMRRGAGAEWRRGELGVTLELGVAGVPITGCAVDVITRCRHRLERGVGCIDRPDREGLLCQR